MLCSSPHYFPRAIGGLNGANSEVVAQRPSVYTFHWPVDISRRATAENLPDIYYRNRPRPKGGVNIRVVKRPKRIPAFQSRKSVRCGNDRLSGSYDNQKLDVFIVHITQSSEEIQLTPFTSSPTSKKPKKVQEIMRDVGFCTLLENQKWKSRARKVLTEPTQDKPMRINLV
jgi:hypothetical protein